MALAMVGRIFSNYDNCNSMEGDKMKLLKWLKDLIEKKPLLELPLHKRIIIMALRDGKK